ncbi:unnamed protein product, partial [Durusdinium trenchii]
MDDLCGFAKSVPVTVVHCERGANRSPAVAAVILALAKGCTFEEAAEYIARLRNRQLSEENGSRPVDVSSFEE